MASRLLPSAIRRSISKSTCIRQFSTAAAVEVVAEPFQEDTSGISMKGVKIAGRPLYLDVQATSPVDPRVLDAMLPYNISRYGNPHSRTHLYGWESDQAVESAREKIAALINASPKEIVFTSGATESNNISVKGVMHFYRDKKRHVITAQTEHKCVLDSCRHLQQEGFEVTYLPVNPDGLIDLEKLRAAIRPDTGLVSVMMVNNEIGVIQPVNEIGKICKEFNVPFHTDAAQALGKIPIDVDKSNISLMSLSAHKLYGPKGVGALYMRRRPRIRVETQMNGGGQERGIRSGTVPTPIVVGFGAACEIAKKEMEYDNKRIKALNERLLHGIRDKIDGVIHLLKLILLLLFHHRQPLLTTASQPPLLPKESLPTKSGYLKVNSTTNSSIFYAYYEAQHTTTPLSQTPILIWLQGGPGCSSMIGNFYELGPWRVSSNLTLEPNPGPWNRIFGLLFLDNPIGVGFSIASSIEEIPKTQHDVAKHLYIAVKKFLKLEISFKQRPIYITGESYAGKYVPAFGYYVLKKNSQSNHSTRLNLRGVAIGDGLTDPISQVGTHALNAYYSGMINEKQKEVLEGLQKETIELTRKGNWSEATDARSRILIALQNMTGFSSLYNYRRQIPYQDELVAELLSYPDVKKSLGAKEDIDFELCSDIVANILHDDVMKSVKNLVEYLVKNTRVLLYQGQCDLRDGVVSVEAWVKKLRWDKIDDYLETERKIWEVEGKLAGYVQKWDDFSNVVLLDAGHLVPTDQPLHAQAMIEDWVLEKGLFRNDYQVIHHFNNKFRFEV